VTVANAIRGNLSLARAPSVAICHFSFDIWHQAHSAPERLIANPKWKMKNEKWHMKP
jgi:hypothetical protein